MAYKLDSFKKQDLGMVIINGKKIRRTTLKIQNFLKGKKSIHQIDMLNFLKDMGYKNYRKTFDVLKRKKFFKGLEITLKNRSRKIRDVGPKVKRNKYSKLNANKRISSWLLGDPLPYWKVTLTKRHIKLTPEYMSELTIKQGGCCYYTGLPLRPFKMESELKFGKGSKRPLSQVIQQVSIDKLDPKKGYVEGNVVLASMLVNMMKGQTNLNQFKTLINIVIKHLDITETNHKPDVEVTSIIKKVKDNYIKKTKKNLRKYQKLYAKNLLNVAEKHKSEVVFKKGKLIRIN